MTVQTNFAIKIAFDFFKEMIWGTFGNRYTTRRQIDIKVKT